MAENIIPLGLAFDPSMNKATLTSSAATVQAHDSKTSILALVPPGKVADMVEPETHARGVVRVKAES